MMAALAETLTTARRYRSSFKNFSFRNFCFLLFPLASQSGHLRFSRLPHRRVSLHRAKCRGSGSRWTAHVPHRFRTVPPAPLAGLGSFPPAPLTAALCLADSAACSRSLRRSQTVETVTDSGAPKDERPRWSRGFARPRTGSRARCFACRPGHRRMAAWLRPARTPQ